jgi:hypothetical protein
MVGIMKNRVKNAVLINYANILFSPSLKLLLIFVTLISACFSFWPLISWRIWGTSSSGYLKFSDNIILSVGVCTINLLFMVLLITRIGAQIGFAKGSKVTELILTSLSRSQLYKAHVISSLFVAVTAILIVYLPMVAAAMVNDPDIGLEFRQINSRILLFLVFHILATACTMVILAISIASLVKRSEDTGAYLMICLFPFLLSLIYVSIKYQLYSGWFSLFNYIPITSMIPSIASGINNAISNDLQIEIILSDLVFIISAYFVGKKIFIKNIAVH